MDFDWSADDAAFRAELAAFLAGALPADWAEVSKDGPGSDAQAAFSRGFCRALAERGWLTQHWPIDVRRARTRAPWRHAILGEEMWARGEPRGSQYMNVNWIGPTIMKYGSEAQKALHLPRISSRRRALVSGLLRARRGLRPRGAAHARAPRRRRLRRERLEDLDLVREQRRLLLPARAHAIPASKRQRGISRAARADGRCPGIEVREIPSVVGERYFHEVFFDGRARARRVPARARGRGLGRRVVCARRTSASARRATRGPRSRSTRSRGRARERRGSPTARSRSGSARRARSARRRACSRYRVIDLRAKGSRRPPTRTSRASPARSPSKPSPISRSSSFGARGARLRELRRGALPARDDGGRRGRRDRGAAQPDREPRWLDLPRE